MKNNTEAKREPTPKTKTPKAARTPATKLDAKPDAKPDTDAEPVDRLPATVEELKATKGGLVTFLFLSGKDKEAIAAELKPAFKLSDAQAVKIARRITGRTRFFQRALSLVSAK